MSELKKRGVCAGHVALVTGASQGGTGTAIAVRLAAEGARVAITARDEKGLASCAESIAEVGGTALVLPADLSDPEGKRNLLVQRTEAELGPVDILVNSAASNGYKPFEKWSRDDLLFIQEVNVWAPWELMKAVLPGMRERGRGWILNLTSFTAELPPGPPYPQAPPSKAGSGYGASKASLNRMTLAAASETEGQGISVNALTPQAAIATRNLVAAGWIEQKWYEPLETMAEAALALCTGDPAKLTGRIAYSLQLLLELRRPVRDLHGKSLVEGWQPDDLQAAISRQLAAHAESGWRGTYDFARPSSPSTGM